MTPTRNNKNPAATGRTVVVIGATGFIGRRVAELLLAQGDRVRALVRPGSRRAGRVPAGCEVRAVALRHGDPALAAALATADAIVYAAGTVRGAAPEDFFPANVEGVAAVAAALAQQADAPPLLVLSSLAAAAPELSAYARSKRRGEEVLRDFPGVTAAALRPTAVYGPGDTELTPLLALMRRGWLPCPAGPEQRLSFIHVDDVARAVLAWLARPAATAGGAFALDDGTPGGYDRAALAASVRPGGRVWPVRVPRPVLATAAGLNLAAARVFGFAPMLTPGKVRELTHPTWMGDNAPFTAATGWRPEITLAEGVRRLFARA